MKKNKPTIGFIYLICMMLIPNKIFSQTYFSENMYPVKDIIVSRNGFNIYEVREIFEDNPDRSIYVLTIELENNIYLNFRYDNGVYAIDFITTYKIENAVLNMKFISDFQTWYTEGNELNITSDFNGFEYAEHINTVNGRSVKKYGISNFNRLDSFDATEYFQYVFAGPNNKAILLCYIIDGYISLNNEKYTIPAESLSAIQDFALIMEVVGLI
jgi:hypothetical protein